MKKIQQSKSRIIIRFLKASDYKVWRKAYTSMLPAQNTWDVEPKRREELSRVEFNILLKRQKISRKNDNSYDFALFRKDTDELIGLVSINNIIRSIGQTAFIGYRLFNRHWGNGFAKEAIQEIFILAFTDLKLHRLVAGVEQKNKRSIKLAKSLGMRKEGLARKVVYLRNSWQDLLQFAITCEELGIPWKGNMT
jgi:ribosomal-protein-alanine N-acetyltransferase